MDFSQLMYEFRSMPLVVEIAVTVIVFSVFVTAFTYISILIQRLKGYLTEKRRARLEPVIDEFVLDELSDTTQSKGIRRASAEAGLQILRQPLFKGRRNRQILLNRLIYFRKNVRGENANQLKRIYLGLDLDRESIRKLKSYRWNTKIKGLQEITTMEVSIPDVNILPLTNSKNRELRSIARIAYLKLSKNEAFKFFDVVTEPMLEWDQIELFRIITTSDDIPIPSFANWIAHSRNKTVVSFCIKLAVHYNQINASEAIIKLLDNRDLELRVGAINAIGQLKLVSAELRLMTMYSSQPVISQIEILKALGRIESGNSFTFLKHEFLNASEFDLRKNAARSLVKSKNISQDIINDLRKIASVENCKILSHCLHPLIQN